jgi:hypothetical protein
MFEVLSCLYARRSTRALDASRPGYHDHCAGVDTGHSVSVDTGHSGGDVITLGVDPGRASRAEVGKQIQTKPMVFSLLLIIHEPAFVPSSGPCPVSVDTPS